MQIVDKPFPGLYVIEGFKSTDLRGTFVKTFNDDLFRKLGVVFRPREEFYSISHKNVIRGLHFQMPPYDHEKLIYCSSGQFLDVLLDLRVGSPTYKKTYTVELNSDKPLLLFLPKGIAHGFMAREDNSVMTYLTSVVYHPEADSGVRWDSIGYAWPCERPIVSDRDCALPQMTGFSSPFIFPVYAPVKAGRALVTGASGFVGSRLVGRLVSDGWATAALLRKSSADSELDREGDLLKYYRVDGDFDSLAKLVADFQPTHVFHTAALTVHDYRPAEAHNLLDANIKFGVNLVESMLANGVRNLVNTGTSWQHFDGAEYSPVNFYAATKQAFEALLQYYAEVKALQVITLKLFDTFGENDPRPKLLNLLTAAESSGTPLALSPGEQLIDLVWVEDVVRAYTVAAGLFNVGPGFLRGYGLSGGERMTLKSFLEMYHEIRGKPAAAILGARPYRPREVMAPWVPSDQLPGWSPTSGAIRSFLAGQR